MPRNVRPAFMVATADGRTSPPVGIGPRAGAMFLSGRVTLRTPAGEVSEEITFDAGGRDNRGAARMSIDIPAGFTVEILTPRGELYAPGAGAVGPMSGRLSIVIRPA
jgi:hypothetical protein